jgi:hypothetical protein
LREPEQRNKGRKFLKTCTKKKGIANLERSLPGLEGGAEASRPRIAGLLVLQDRVGGRHRLPLHNVHVQGVQVLLVLLRGVALELPDEGGEVRVAGRGLLLAGSAAHLDKCSEARCCS